MNRYSPNSQSGILPQFYYNDQLEAKYIRQAGQKMWRLYADEIHRLSINQFILTADEQGIAAYEERLGILPDLATEDLEFRRLRLLNRNQTKPPFTLEYLQERLDDLLGESGYLLTMDYPNYTWIRQHKTLTMRIGAATQTGTELRIYPILNDELTAQTTLPITIYCATGAQLSIYPKE